MFKRYILSLIILVLSSGSALAEIYSWEDEEGKTHYGDSVPDEKADVQVIPEVETNSINLEERNQEGRGILSSSQSRETKRSTGTHQSEYDRQLQEYNESQACFASCRQHSAGGYNNSACGHCKEVSRPSQ